MFCLKCGAKVPQGMNQCVKCGATVEDEYCGGFWGLVGENRSAENAVNNEYRQGESCYTVPEQSMPAAVFKPDDGNMSEEKTEKDDAMKHMGIVWGLIGVCAGMLILLGIMLLQVNRLNGRIRSLSDSVETLSQRDGEAITGLGKDVSELKTSLSDLQDEVLNSVSGSAAGTIEIDDKMAEESSEKEEITPVEEEETEVDIAGMMESVTAIQREIHSLENNIPSGTFEKEEEFLDRLQVMLEQIGTLRENIRGAEEWVENLEIAPENVQDNLSSILEILQELNQVDFVYYPGALMDSRLGDIEDILRQDDMRPLDGAEVTEDSETSDSQNEE